MKECSFYLGGENLSKEVGLKRGYFPRDNAIKAIKNDNIQEGGFFEQISVKQFVVLKCRRRDATFILMIP